MTRAFSLTAILICAASGAATDVAARSASSRGKISGEILAHRRAKIASGKSSEFERCAVYCARRLSKAEIDDLATRGIDVNGWAWVPPVDGRHPHGFHLARVRYERLGDLESDPRVLRVVSSEGQLFPLNDVTGETIGLRAAHVGAGGIGRTGAGVLVAIADSGLDIDHADIPTPVETFDVTEGENPTEWDCDVTNLVTNHGTHVAGICVGRGELSNGRYRGAAPDAELAFYKIGNDDNAFATINGTILAVLRAVEIGCDVFNYSYGSLRRPLDGSSLVSQAFDAAFAEGMVCVIGAGNSGTGREHALLAAAPQSTSDFIVYRTPQWEVPESGEIDLHIVWLGPAGIDDVELICDNLIEGEELILNDGAVSPRGTRSRSYSLRPSFPENRFERSFTLRARNMSTVSSGSVHLLVLERRGRIVAGREPGWTVSIPGTCDTGITVGNWASRASWIDFEGQAHTLSTNRVHLTSSHGPRIDGARKPEIVAPGTGVISAKDTDVRESTRPEICVDNDGMNLDGSGPADYLVSTGTSMSSPAVAGLVALLIEEDPLATPDQIRLATILSASLREGPPEQVGYGLVDALRALELLRAGIPDGCDLDAEPFVDCDQDGVPDHCELSGGTAEDANGNGIIDDCESPFHRGDTNRDGRLDLSDGVAVFVFLFLGDGRIDCTEAADANDDGRLDITDGVVILDFLFRGGAPLPEPGPPGEACGSNEESGTYLGCGVYGACG